MSRFVARIHALHEESDARTVRPRRDRRISIHALHEESDVHLPDPHGIVGISIHALHEESDVGFGLADVDLTDFNPRSP